VDVGAWTYGEHVPEQTCASSSSLWGANNPLLECNLGWLSMDQIANPGLFYELFAPNVQTWQYLVLWSLIFFLCVKSSIL